MVDPLGLLGKSIFTDNQMLFVFFFYGLGFIVLGIVTFTRKSRIIEIDLTKSFYYLGAFGIIHGLTEWLDLLRLYFKIMYGLQYAFLNSLKLVMLLASFVFLMQFGLNILTLITKKYKGVRIMPIYLLIIFIVATVMTGRFSDSELFIRVLFGFTASMISSMAFFKLRSVFMANNLDAMVNGSTLMAAAFAVYAIFSGVITFPILGIPPQVVRMLCSLTIGYASFRLLTVLESGLKKS